jgi:hypothetical protein
MGSGSRFRLATFLGTAVLFSLVAGGITPSGRPNRVVHGFIGVDTIRPDTGSGDEVQRIPYTYRIGRRR